MKYEPNTIYHIYNQGNNKQCIFYQTRNYYFFRRKMKQHLLPYVDMMCYCLMPNHFHWLVYTRPEACSISSAVKPRRKFKNASDEVSDYQQALSHSIGTLLSSYTQAINRQENRTGSLFRARTKAKNGWITDLVSIHGVHRSRFFSMENDYARQCFDYIHKNPVTAGLVKSPGDWPYSSYRSYAGMRKTTVCNRRLTDQLLSLPRRI